MSEKQAREKLDSIKNMVDRLDSEDGTQKDEAVEAIIGTALSVQIREDWHEANEDGEPSEYYILLSSGGGGCRIIGTLSGNDPDSAVIEHQDWFERWTKLETTVAEEEILLKFAQEFYFG